MRGNITRRGKASWRLKFDAGRDSATGKRLTKFITFRGTRRDAERELTRLLTAVDGGTLVDPNKVTVGEYLDSWLGDAGADLAPKTLERYRQLSDQQIKPHIGATVLQKLRPSHVQEWHSTLLKSGGKGGKPLSARTVGHAHRVLHRALARAATAEVVSRNVAAAIKPPKVVLDPERIMSLKADQVPVVLERLKGHALFPIAALAIGSGARRGELCGLRWGDIDLLRNSGGSIKIERSIEETKAGLRVKPPKTKHGRRTVTIPAMAVEALRALRLQYQERRLALGLGKIEPGDLVFASVPGEIPSPDNLSRDWRRTVKALKLPEIPFHGLRHTHASMLISSGIDVLSVSRRLGHGSPAFTLSTYAQFFEDRGDAAAKAIDTFLVGKADK
jgi:integrase